MVLGCDARIAPVEANLLGFLGGLMALPMFETVATEGVQGFRSGLPHPLFNGFVGGGFAPGSEARRSRELIAPLVEAELPFLWWATPSTWSEGLDRTLVEAGAQRDDSPGMHIDLRELTPGARPVDGLAIGVAGPRSLAAVVGIFCEVFGVPAELAEPCLQVFSSLDPSRFVNVLATLDGVPVGAGSLCLTGTTAGLYNIAVVDAARQRGVGYAVTETLMDHARARGCTDSILTASAMGRPVYERIGYAEVCQVPQYVWLPGPV